MGWSLVVLLAVLGAITTAAPATAHGPASTLVRVALVHPATESSGPVVRITARVALQQLDDAYDTTLSAEARRTGAAATVARHHDELEQLVADRVGLAESDGVPWTVQVDRLEAGSDQGQDAVRVVLRGTGPVGAASEVQLTWHLVTDDVVTHKVFVGGVSSSGKTTLIEVLTHDDPVADLVLEGAQTATARSMLAVGFDHFRSGTDHILFLCLLGLGVVARRKAGWGSTLKRLLMLSVAFTLGHSLSLALASLGIIDLPSRWVETAIAATILLTAVHAVRPRLGLPVEVALTAGFGVVHGLGFAGNLEELHLRGTALIRPLLEFNLGLEAAQLLALGVLILPLFLLARSALAIRVLAAAVACAAAAWILQRAFDVANPIDPIVSLIVASPERLALLLLVPGLMLWLTRRDQGRRVPADLAQS